jgi:hypothetical protein
MLSTDKYTQAEIDEANESEQAAVQAAAVIKASKAIFVNLKNEGEYVNTLDENGAYIRISRCHRHRVGSHEEMGIKVSLVSPEENHSIFLVAPAIHANFWVYGGKAIERRRYSVMPSQDVIDRAVEQLCCEYKAASNG